MKHWAFINLDVTDLAWFGQDLLDRGYGLGRLVWGSEADMWDIQGFSVVCVKSAMMDQAAVSFKPRGRDKSRLHEVSTAGDLPRMCRPAHGELPPSALVALATGLNSDLPVKQVIKPRQLNRDLESRHPPPPPSFQVQLTLPSTARPRPHAPPRPGTSQPPPCARSPPARPPSGCWPGPR